MEASQSAVTAHSVQTVELSIVRIQKVAEDTTEVTFDTSAVPFVFEAGQYIRITLPELSNDVLKGNTRDFTISSSPHTKDSIAVTFRDTGSPFKEKLLSMHVGQRVLVRGPLGVFMLPQNYNTPLIFIALGVGITPFISMLRAVAASHLPYNIQLLYANSNPKRAAYKEEIQALAAAHHTITLVEIEGQVTTEVIAEKLTYTPDTLWYLCGIPEAVSSLVELIPQELGVAEANFRTEEYTGYHKSKIEYKVAPLQPEGLSTFRVEDVQDLLLNPLLAATSESALIAVTDVQGNILYVNNKFVEVSKYSREELIGQNHRILKSGYHEPQIYEEMWYAISSGNMWRGEIKNRAKDGTFYWVDASISPIFTEDGKTVQGYVATRFLITDKKDLQVSRAETEQLLTEVQSEKEKLTAILESIDEGVLVIDTARRIIRMNKTAARIASVSEEASAGKLYTDVFRFVVEESGADDTQFVTHVLEHGQELSAPDDTLTVLKKVDGESVPVARVATPWRGPDEALLGAVIVFRDITRERQIDKAKTNIISLASHQLRTPLTSLRWDLDSLRGGEVGTISSEQKELLGVMSQSGQRMADLINILLYTSNLELGLFTAKNEAVSISELANPVIAHYEEEYRRKEIAFIHTIDSTLPQLSADPTVVTMIFNTLLSNASRYTPANGSVTLDIAQEGDAVIVRVQDTGYGIPEEQHNQVFSKLFRGENIKSVDTEGKGMELFVLKSILEKTGCSITFDSTQNTGTTFSVSIPVSGMAEVALASNPGSG